MFEEDEIVIYNGRYRVVEQVSFIGVHFKDCINEPFSFAPIRLVKKVAITDIFCVIMKKSPYVIRHKKIFEIAIMKRRSKHLRI